MVPISIKPVILSSIHESPQELSETVELAQISVEGRRPVDKYVVGLWEGFSRTFLPNNSVHPRWSHHLLIYSNTVTPKSTE